MHGESIVVADSDLCLKLIPKHSALLSNTGAPLVSSPGSFGISYTLSSVHSFLDDERPGLRTPNEGINQRYLKNWADVADKICCPHT